MKMLLILILMQVALICRSQYINIKTAGGDMISEEMNSIQKMTLPNENMVIHFNNSTTETISLYTIEKIYFGPLTSSDNGMKPIGNIPYIMANPASSELIVMNLPQNRVNARIYSIQGELLEQASVSAVEYRINISSLSNGLYILKLNEITLKFVKQ